MKIGIDFGTTRVVVASVDRGNFPLVNFEAPDGQLHDWFPPVVAVHKSERRYGWEAMGAQQEEDWTVLRSLKRALRTAGPHTEVQVDGELLPLRLLMAEMMAALKTQLLLHSNLDWHSDSDHSGDDPAEAIEVMLGVPASANSNQRYLTEEAAWEAGFTVLGLLNEPSAAAIEFTHRYGTERKSRAGSGLVVYDLGGGTFDVSLVTLGEAEHTVEATDGIATLGGDDFDQVLADLVLEQLSGQLGGQQALTAAEQFRLLEECREKKEALNANSRRITLDLEAIRAGWKPLTLSVDDYYERCRPMIEQTRVVVERLLAQHAERSLDTLYVTGGGAELPPVARVLRENFGRKVKRSAYMRSASAIGLAIRAAAAPGKTPEDTLHEQFNRNFGIWRETDHGGTIFFDLIFARGLRLPTPGAPPVRIERVYQPAHNIGHFRYLECSQLDPNQQPSGEITNWNHIAFPFDPQLQEHPQLASLPVTMLDDPRGLSIREEYSCDATGKLRVKISAEPAGYEREFSIDQIEQA